MEFTKKVTKVEVKYSAYYKSVATPPYESGATLYIENTKYTPTLSEELPEPVETITYEYTTPSDSVEFSNKGENQRVFIDSIKLFF